ncbi:MAG TPA: heavy metal-binding domain-containing protein [Pyrinomonadaceae bacterium]|nr:heavy metal-binding domain-containing protein [Pyrinomonadaceae bacterium]
MPKRIYAALIALAAAMSFAGTADAAVTCDGHHQCQHKSARRTRQHASAARGRKRTQRRSPRRAAVAYVCPMHADIRERARGTCPKCLMDLVAEPRGAKTGGAKTDARAEEAGPSAPGRL